MKFLELKVPPLLLLAMVAVAMWLADRLAPSLAVPLPDTVRRAVAIALAVGGVVTAMAGVVGFRSSRTTVNPLQPDSASTLVTGGVYAVSRNPMYLGFLLLLAAWAVLLANSAAALLLPLFVLYMNRFQIIPEERALATVFGDAFHDYARRTRRWL